MDCRGEAESREEDGKTARRLGRVCRLLTAYAMRHDIERFDRPPVGEASPTTPTVEAPDPVVDWQAYRERNVVEWLINRHEKRAASDLAMLTLVAIPLWL